MKKLGVLLTHPIQYQSPFLALLSEKVDLTVFYCSSNGGYDPGFGSHIIWDRELCIKNAKTIFIRNISPIPSVNTFFGVINPGIISSILRGNFDAFLIHGYSSTTSLLAYMACLFSRTPIFFRGETVLRPSGILKRAVKRAFLTLFFFPIQTFFAIGQVSLRFYREFGIPSSKIFLTPYAVDNNFFLTEASHLQNKNVLRRELDLPDLPTLLFCAKLIPRKRPMDLLRAFARLPEGMCSLVFVGDGPLRRELEGHVYRKNIQNVFFKGFQNQSKLPRYYAVSDIFVFPSEYESFGLTLNEAMCFSLPILCSTGVSGAYDLVRENENGFFFNIGDTEKIAILIQEVINDSPRLIAFGKRSQEIIRNWNYEACVSAVMMALGNIK